MDSGDVESSGAVDYIPDVNPDVNNGGPVNVENSVGKIATEDVHFHASDISRPDNKEFFNNPKAQKRKEKEEKKRIKAEVKQMLKESRPKRKAAGASADVVESEKKLKKEQSRIESEHRQAKIGAFLERRAKHWYIYVISIVVVALTVCGIIFVPKIVGDIIRSQNEKYVEENTTPILSIFKEVIGKELSRDEIAEIATKYGSDVEVKYYIQSATITPSGSDFEYIRMLPVEEDSKIYHLFSYSKRGDWAEGDVLIYQSQDGFSYVHGSNKSTYDTAKEAVDAYVLDMRDQK